MYVMIPSTVFFYILGVITGFVLLFIILLILSKKQEKKNKQNVEDFLKNFNITGKDDK